VKAFLLALVLGFNVPGAIVIHDDPGGAVSTYVDWYRRIMHAHIPVKIEGPCVSACTLVLMLPKSQVCVGANGSLGFHEATISGVPSMPATRELIEEFYPPIVQAWLRGKKLTVEHIEYMHSDEIVRLGVFNACDDA
jgi:hypothetical protein